MPVTETWQALKSHNPSTQRFTNCNSTYNSHSNNPNMHFQAGCIATMARSCTARSLSPSQPHTRHAPRHEQKRLHCPAQLYLSQVLDLLRHVPQTPQRHATCQAPAGLLQVQVQALQGLEGGQGWQVCIRGHHITQQSQLLKFGKPSVAGRGGQQAQLQERVQGNSGQQRCRLVY